MLGMRWAIEDDTRIGQNVNKGYFSLTLDGSRVCDFFPYARGANEALIREVADRICATMNAADGQN